MEVEEATVNLVSSCSRRACSLASGGAAAIRQDKRWRFHSNVPQECMLDTTCCRGRGFASWRLYFAISHVAFRLLISHCRSAKRETPSLSLWLWPKCRSSLRVWWMVSLFSVFCQSAMLWLIPAYIEPNTLICFLFRGWRGLHFRAPLAQREVSSPSQGDWVLRTPPPGTHDWDREAFEESGHGGCRPEMVCWLRRSRASLAFRVDPRCELHGYQAFAWFDLRYCR